LRHLENTILTHYMGVFCRFSHDFDAARIWGLPVVAEPLLTARFNDRAGYRSAGMSESHTRLRPVSRRTKRAAKEKPLPDDDVRTGSAGIFAMPR